MNIWTTAGTRPDQFDVVTVDSLGWTKHSPGKTKDRCWIDLRTSQGLSDDKDQMAQDLAAAVPRSIGELTMCWWHRWPWPHLSNLAIWCWQNPEHATEDKLRDELRRTRLDPDLAGQVALQILDPMRWDPAERTLTNGIHRLCAFRVAGVQNCLVRVR